MEEKLKKLMKHEGLNSTRLAEMLGIQASGISHIMSGRNKPSYDFIVKMLHRFPQINPDWLLLDKGSMYREEIKGKIQAAPQAGLSAAGQAALRPDDLFSSQSASYRRPQVEARPFERDDEDIIPSESSSIIGLPASKPAILPDSVPASSIERIVVFYTDKTFMEYQPV